MTVPVTNEEAIEQLLVAVAELRLELIQARGSIDSVWNYAFSLENKIENIEREMPRDC